jgi:DNA-binding transcriptional regulator GbsR (MarR family)
MDNTAIPTGGDTMAALPHAEPLIRQFVEHWGLMARSWGINSSMGELFALLYVTGNDWTAEDLRRWLGVSRGNVSMNLRELLAWGVVHKVHRAGERRELFRAETEVWILFRKILRERKRRELEPSLHVLETTSQMASDHDELRGIGKRIEALLRFFHAIDALADQLLTMPAGDLAEISHLLPGDDGRSSGHDGG